jgi:molecular chaperone GrpE
MTKKKSNDEDNFIDEEIVAESDSDHVSFRGPESKMKKLKEELIEAKKEKGEYLDGWQRAQADYHNLKAQVSREKTDTIKYAKQDLIEQLIPLADSFEMAWSNEEIWAKTPANWRQGMEYIYKELINILEANGLEAIDPKSQPFNPKEHEAVESVPVEDKKKMI